jgi:hypothetical protein
MYSLAGLDGAVMNVLRINYLCFGFIICVLDVVFFSSCCNCIYSSTCCSC